jgi:hypothetical protein
VQKRSRQAIFNGGDRSGKSSVFTNDQHDKVICSPYRSSLHNFKKMKVALRYLVIFGKYDDFLATVDEGLFNFLKI